MKSLLWAPTTVQALLTWLLMIDCCRGRGKLSNQGVFRKESPTSAANCVQHPASRFSTSGKACALWKLQVYELAHEV